MTLANNGTCNGTRRCDLKKNKKIKQFNDKKTDAIIHGDHFRLEM